MSRRNLQIAGVLAIVLVVVVVVVVTQFTGGNSNPEPTPSTSPTASPGPSPSASPQAGTPVPTSDPTATPVPTPTSTPTPTPTPLPPDVAFMTIALLANEMGVPPSGIRLIAYEQDTWPAADLGCPAPGAFYAQVRTGGWVFILDINGVQNEVHTGESVAVIVNCTANRELMASAINVVDLAGLRSTREIEVGRRNSEGTFSLVATVTDPEVIQRLVDSLDLPISTNPEASCSPVFELVFITDGSRQPVEAICGGNTRLIRGGQSFWTGQDGTAPREFANLVGPLVSDLPIPTLPTASP